MSMKILLLTICLFACTQVNADVKEKVALKYFEFLFYEDQLKESNTLKLIDKPLVSSFYSKDGHRMIIVSSHLSNKKSYYVLLSVNELKMGYLAWKSRGYGLNPEKDIASFMAYNGKEFDFDGW